MAFAPCRTSIALEHGVIDDVAVAAAFTQRTRLRHAVDHVERLAAAQTFARVRHLLAAGREARDQIAEHGGDVVVNCELRVQLGCGHDGHCVRNRAQRPFDAARSHHHFFDFAVDAIGGGGRSGQNKGDCGGQGGARARPNCMIGMDFC